MSKLYYGLKSKTHAIELAVAVCCGLGKENDLSAEQLLLGTACAETKLGAYPDNTPKTLGVGLCQHDQIGLDDIKQEGEQRHFDIVQKLWGYDMLTIDLADLANDPLLSFICCRLSYKRIPAAIPNSLKDKAAYWKKHYNTVAGKGTEQHFVDAFIECLGDK